MREIPVAGKKVLFGVFGLITLLVFAPRLLPFFTVSYGEVAVVSRFGQIDRTAWPGLNFKLPVIEKAERFRTQKIIYETSENAADSRADYKDEPVDTSTLDGQQVSIRYTVRFRMIPEKVRWIAENVGYETQVLERIVKSESRSVVRNIARQFKAQELYTGDIFKFQEEVQNRLAGSFAQNGLEIDEFLVRQIKFSPDYVSAVEQKQIESERVKTEEYKAEQEKFKKLQVITKAEGEARAQEILRTTLSDQVLQKLAIDKWNGILPTYFGSGAMPFLNLNR